MEVTTVADDLVVIHDGLTVYRYDGLTPATSYTFNGLEVTTLDRPNGALLSTFATVNDVHFGELECGRIDNDPKGPIQRAQPGEPPYPETMNRSAVAEISALNPQHVFVKGDLTCIGSDEEFVAFENCYGQFGDKLHVIRGNHDSYLGQHKYDEDQWIEMPGICVALMDTAIPTETTGDIAAIFLSNSAMINYPGNDNGDDTVWLAFENRVPPEGTNLTLIIAPYPKPQSAEQP